MYLDHSIHWNLHLWCPLNVFTRFRLFEPLHPNTHLLTWFGGDYWYVFRSFYQLKFASLMFIERVYQIPTFWAPAPLCPIYLNNNNTHLLRSFGGNYWYVFRSFYQLKFASLMFVECVYQISTFWAPAPLCPIYLNNNTHSLTSFGGDYWCTF